VDSAYRFAPDIGWLTHLWKSSTRQDHAHLRPILQRMLPPDGVAVDVGAHGGQVTRLLAGLLPRGMVIAIEPSSYARSVLRPSLWLRGTQNVAIMAAALGSAQGIATLRTPIKRRGDMGYGLAHLGDAGGAAREVIETVAVTTLDALADAMALQRLDFVKVDIEGGEAAFLAGARGAIERFRPTMLIEHDAGFLARAGADHAALWSALAALGYRPNKLSNGSLVAIAPAHQPAQGDVWWLPD
jgi:FkbM family methyltransferase